jgi:hypothetical protein
VPPPGFRGVHVVDDDDDDYDDDDDDDDDFVCGASRCFAAALHCNGLPWHFAPSGCLDAVARQSACPPRLAPVLGRCR